ncbi:MAG: hypothetical protein H6842_08430 [Rhodospirillaceae bacterium]|nr:hypothetical protein [Rhodospirillaceae bacterium]
MAKPPDTAQRPAANGRAPPREELIAHYKRLLQTYIDRRPSGTRQKIAAALGTNKSFVSQITSPAYAVPVPESHVDTIMALCHFSAEERESFLGAYAEAHPGRGGAADNGARCEPSRRLLITVPVFRDAGVQQEVEDLIKTFADRVVRLARRSE